MADIVLTIDPDDTAFALHDRANGRRVLGFDAPVPETDSQWAYSADTEGERRANLRYRNREITVQVLLDKSTAALLEALENTLGQKVGKLAREGGELRFTYPTGTAITFNVLEASMRRTFDIMDMVRFRAQYEISFICEPFGLGIETDLGDNTETTLPVLVFTEATIPGDVPALGRLVIDEDDADNQWWLTWGIQSRYYSSSANAALFYEAEGRSDLLAGAGFSSIAGASASSNIDFTNLLQTTYRALLSTASTGGTHLSHVGDFRVYVRSYSPTANTGAVTIALEWSEGDFLRSTRNAETTIPTADEGRWRLVDLGIVSLKPVASGTQRWEGRIIAKSTVAGDSISFDYLMLIPVSEGSGIVSGVSRVSTPTTFSAYDAFTSTTSGNALNGRSPVTGAAWATSGAATDFAFIDASAATYNTTEAVSRSVSTGGGSFRFGVVGSNMTDMRIQTVIGFEAISSTYPGGLHGVTARWVDSSNYLYFTVSPGTFGGFPVNDVALWTVVSGSGTAIASPSSFTMPAGRILELDLTVLANGRAIGRVFDYSSGNLLCALSATSSVLATGGALASGKPGIVDMGDGTGTYERFWDDIRVTVPPVDAAIFASQSLEIRSDRVVREDSGGAVWGAPSSYKGDYLLVPPSGAEARTSRVIIKASRADPLTEGDPAIDDISARLFVTPRYLVVPAA